MWAKENQWEETMPKVFKELKNIFLKLEKHYKDMQDIEFTVENKKNYGCYKLEMVSEQPRQRSK